MGNFQRNDNNRGSGFGFSGNRGGDRGSFGGRPSFGKKPWERGGDSRRDDGPREMHKATCGECGNTCEVPFRPTGEKPVFCNDCFGSKRESYGDRPTPSYTKREERPSYGDRPKFNAGGDSSSSSDLKNEIVMLSKAIQSLNDKIEALTVSLGGETFSKTKTVKAAKGVEIAELPEEVILEEVAVIEEAPKKKRASKKVVTE